MNAGDFDGWFVREVGSKTLDVRGFVDVVELGENRALELTRDRRKIDPAHESRDEIENPRACLCASRGTISATFGYCTFTATNRPSSSDAAMHLRERRGRGRVSVELGEVLGDPTEIFFDDLQHNRCGSRRHAVLELRELAHVGVGQQIWAAPTRTDRT